MALRPDPVSTAFTEAACTERHAVAGRVQVLGRSGSAAAVNHRRLPGRIQWALRAHALHSTARTHGITAFASTYAASSDRCRRHHGRRHVSVLPETAASAAPYDFE